jgi:hypothetical protein
VLICSTEKEKRVTEDREKYVRQAGDPFSSHLPGHLREYELLYNLPTRFRLEEVMYELHSCLYLRLSQDFGTRLNQLLHI